jgi:WD40 repeat protein
VGTHAFISYSREDRPRVQKIAQALESKGLSVWWDPHLKTGTGFRAEISQALAQAKAVIVVWSRNSVTSRFVCDEADEGAARGILFPVLLDRVDIPLGFRQIQTADLTRWRGRMSDPALIAFVSHVTRGAKASRAAPGTVAPHPQPDDEPPPPARAKPGKAKPAKAKPQAAPKPAKEIDESKFMTTGAKLRAGLISQSLLLTVLAAGGFAAIAYGAEFIFEAYRPAFVGALAALAFLSRYGTFQADHALGAASTNLLSRSYLSLIFFSLILLAPILAEGRIYAAALQGVQVRGIEGADINGVAFDQSGKKLLTASDDGTVRVWDAATGVETGAFRDHAQAEGEERWVWSAAFSPDGALAVTAGRDQTARIFRTTIVAPVMTLAGHSRSVKDAAWHPGGEAIATGSNDATIRIWDVATGETVRILNVGGGGVNAIDFSPDGERLASASDDGVVRLWDWRSGRRIDQASIGAVAEDVRFSKDGASVVAAAESGRARVWRAQGLDKVRDFNHGARGYAAVFASGGASVATAGVDGVIRVWSLEDGSLLQEIAGHRDGVRALDSDGGGARIVSGSRDNTARIWDAATGKELETVGHVTAAMRLPVAIDAPPYFVASRAPTPVDFRGDPGAAGALLGKGAIIASALALSALFLKGLLWAVRIRPASRLTLTGTLGAVSLYLAALIASALPIEALWLWLTLAFVPAAILAFARWLVLGPLLGSHGKKSGDGARRSAVASKA